MTEPMPMPEPTDEAKRFWGTYEQWREEFTKSVAKEIMLKREQMEEGKHENPDR